MSLITTLKCIIKEHFWSKDKCLSMNRRERIEKQQSTNKKLGYRVRSHFWLPLVFTIIHRSGRPLLCIIVNGNGR